MINRRGSLLIIVAGLITLLASLAMAFLMRMRADADDMSWLMRETQARIMLAAACNYIQEASRLGWDDPSTSAHEEGFGWIDVRNGSQGPKPTLTDTRDRFPIGTVARFPMYRMTRPPYAIQRQMVYNEIRTPVSDNPVAMANGLIFGVPWLIKPDPQPVVDNGWNPNQNVTTNVGTVNAANWAAFAAGNRWPVVTTTKRAWFRIYRQGPAEFVVTCGGGGTLGFQDYAEAVADGHGDDFANSQELFDAMRAIEVRLWYLVEWSAATAAPTRNNLSYRLHDLLVDADPGPRSNSTDSVRFADTYVTGPVNYFQESNTVPAPSNGNPAWVYDRGNSRPQMFAPNQVGTIRMIMRLRTPPSNW